jgi:iron complex transport system substrate-binding protein
VGQADLGDDGFRLVGPPAEGRAAATMRRRLIVGLALLGALLASTPPAEAARVVADSAGRRVEVPDQTLRVFPAGPPATVLLYVLAPETLLGWPRAFRGDEAAYVAAPYRNLPVLGRLTGRGGDANLEVVLAARPDLILDFGSVAPSYVSLADRVQAQTGVPYVLIDCRFANTAPALRLMGEILGVDGRAGKLAAYTEKTFADLDAMLAEIPQEQRPRVYLARGPEGLETGVRGSINTEIIERVGAINVADAPGQRGIINVSIEQVLLWNPEVVVTWDDRFYERVWDDPLWQGTAAVRSRRVYLSPAEPFGWIDRPPSINRLLGMRWLASVLYPEQFEGDLRAMTREFYALFYQVDLSERQLDDLLAGATR